MTSAFMGKCWTFCFWTFIFCPKMKFSTESFFTLLKNFQRKPWIYFKAFLVRNYLKQFCKKYSFFATNGVFWKLWIGHFLETVQKFDKNGGKWLIYFLQLRRVVHLHYMQIAVHKIFVHSLTKKITINFEKYSTKM